MPAAFSKPIEDTVEKVNQEVAVGEDLDFQNRWWRFERATWIVFTLIIALDLAGAFGRGPLAHAQLQSAASSLTLKYDRIERSGTPSMLNIDFAAPAIRDGKINLFVSESIARELGAQRVVPQPSVTRIGNGGLAYTFPASATPASVQFALEPSKPGIYRFTLQVEGEQPLSARVVVMP